MPPLTVYTSDGSPCVSTWCLETAEDLAWALGAGAVVRAVSPSGEWTVWVEGADYPDSRMRNYHLFLQEMKRHRRWRISLSKINK
jgi:hypothetical protein